MYKHVWFDGQDIHLPVGKVVCVGRNYAEHARELNNPVPDEPLLFIKPSTSVTPLAQPIILNKAIGDVHYEAEIAVLIGKTLTSVDEKEAEAGILGVGLALDLTLRELQSTLKEKGHPWEKAKAFDGSCPLSGFVPAGHFSDLQNIPMRLMIDGQVRQDGNSAQMLWEILPLLCYISRFFSLLPGDVVLTGTPSGVGKLSQGMELVAELPDLIAVKTLVN